MRTLFALVLPTLLQLPGTSGLSQPASYDLDNEFGVGVGLEPGQASDPVVFSGELMSGGVRDNLKGATLVSVGGVEITERSQYRPMMKWMWCRTPSEVTVKVRASAGRLETFKAFIHVERYPWETNLVDDITRYGEAFRLAEFCLLSFTEDLDAEIDANPRDGTLDVLPPDGTRALTLRFVRRDDALELMIEVDLDIHRQDPALIKRIIAETKPSAEFEEFVVYDRDETTPIELYVTSGALASTHDLRKAVKGLLAEPTPYQKRLVDHNVASMTELAGFEIFRSECEDDDDGGACVKAGELLFFGRHIPKDPARGLEFYERACALGDVEGCVAAGHVNEVGDGVSKDLDAAKRHYQSACDLRSTVNDEAGAALAADACRSARSIGTR